MSSSAFTASFLAAEMESKDITSNSALYQNDETLEMKTPEENVTLPVLLSAEEIAETVRPASTIAIATQLYFLPEVKADNNIVDAASVAPQTSNESLKIKDKAGQQHQVEDASFSSPKL